MQGRAECPFIFACAAYAGKTWWEKDTDYFFPVPDRTMISPVTVYQRYRRYLEKAGIPHGGKGHGPRLHDIRHTFAVHVLQKWRREGAGLSSPAYSRTPLFTNRSRKPLTRAGVTYILNKYAREAQTHGVKDISNEITPHWLRHSRAIHLLQSGVNLVYIRDLLGCMREHECNTLIVFIFLDACPFFQAFIFLFSIYHLSARPANRPAFYFFKSLIFHTFKQKWGLSQL